MHFIITPTQRVMQRKFSDTPFCTFQNNHTRLFKVTWCHVCSVHSVVNWNAPMGILLMLNDKHLPGHPAKHTSSQIKKYGSDMEEYNSWKPKTNNVRKCLWKIKRKIYLVNYISVMIKQNTPLSVLYIVEGNNRFMLHFRSFLSKFTWTMKKV